MNEPNKEYIEYLNSLNSYNAKNKNAYSERNIDSKYFSDTLVRVGVCDFIINKFNTEEPQVVLLTGQAGDGKTSILYQVLTDFGISFDNKKNDFSIVLPSGKECRCIKDFSEYSDIEKESVMKEIIHYPEEGKFVFIVANTGPFINTYRKLFDKSERNKEEILLVGAINRSSGKCDNDLNFNISIINIATIDNTYFVSKFLTKIIDEPLWEKCSQCSKHNVCPILRNRRLIFENKTKVMDFITNHYSWSVANGTRLTIRSITEHMSFILTGGLSCSQIKADDNYDLLYSNLFFGYRGTEVDKKAQRIIAIKEAAKWNYDSKKLAIDNQLLVKNDYESVFSEEISTLLRKLELRYKSFDLRWCSLIRRLFMFMNKIYDEELNLINTKNLFSNNYPIFIGLRQTEAKSNRQLKNSIINALSMIYTGVPVSNEAASIPITLSRRNGITQTVQLISGQININSIQLIKKETKDGFLNNTSPVYDLYLSVNEHILNIPLTLPMLDYFEDLKNGIIETVLDPQLSHGVESLKAQINAVIGINSEDNNSFELYVIKNDKPDKLNCEISGGKLTIN